MIFHLSVTRVGTKLLLLCPNLSVSLSACPVNESTSHRPEPRSGRGVSRSHHGGRILPTSGSQLSLFTERVFPPHHRRQTCPGPTTRRGPVCRSSRPDPGLQPKVPSTDLSNKYTQSVNRLLVQKSKAEDLLRWSERGPRVGTGDEMERRRDSEVNPTSEVTHGGDGGRGRLKMERG